MGEGLGWLVREGLSGSDKLRPRGQQGTDGHQALIKNMLRKPEELRASGAAVARLRAEQQAQLGLVEMSKAGQESLGSVLSAIHRRVSSRGMPGYDLHFRKSISCCLRNGLAEGGSKESN